ncbi:MAG: hypothetical protein IJ137_05770 [Eubacterium sp.]|nr:hypothetical protein [Eubacterium sp.]
MRKKVQKCRHVKRSLAKCKGLCVTYDKLQYAYADKLEESDAVAEFRCNVVLEGSEETEEYMSDFVCVKTDGELMVRECVFRSRLAKPMAAKWLELSRNYWMNRGVTDWGIVIDEA